MQEEGALNALPAPEETPPVVMGELVEESIQPESLTEPLTEPLTGATVNEPVTPIPAPASNRKVSGTEPTEPKPAVKKPLFTVKRVLMVLGVLLAVVWAVRMLMPKPQQEGVTDADAIKQ